MLYNDPRLSQGRLKLVWRKGGGEEDKWPRVRGQQAMSGVRRSLNS